MKQKITGPREFFEELNLLLRSIAVESTTPQTKDALAKVCSYLNPREVAVPHPIARLGAPESARFALCEAADVLRTIGLDGMKKQNKEALRLCKELQCFIALLSIEPTWSDGGAA